MLNHVFCVCLLVLVLVVAFYFVLVSTTNDFELSKIFHSVLLFQKSGGKYSDTFSVLREKKRKGGGQQATQMLTFVLLEVSSQVMDSSELVNMAGVEEWSRVE